MLLVLFAARSMSRRAIFFSTADFPCAFGMQSPSGWVPRILGRTDGFVGPRSVIVGLLRSFTLRRPARRLLPLSPSLRGNYGTSETRGFLDTHLTFQVCLSRISRKRREHGSRRVRRVWWGSYRESSHLDDAVFCFPLACCFFAIGRSWP